ncbi:MAG: histone deacetylase family protein [Acidovorax sp.]
MITFYNEEHVQHEGRFEMFRGMLVPCYEVSARALRVVDELRSRKLGPIESAPILPVPISNLVHSERYLAFLKSAWSEWVSLDPENGQRDILGSVWPSRTLRSDIEPSNFAARVGLYSFDAGTPMTAGTWRATQHGAACTLAATAQVLTGQRAAFALTRPPGHHAGWDFFGGYCFINNAAIAAQSLRDGGARRVAILDIDYHHGNGTQTIFYGRPDVFYISIHGDPRTEYPFFLGHADETGEGEGLGHNLNLPLPRGAGFAQWREALARALASIASSRSDALVVSLGADTSEEDPISGFKLARGDFLAIGKALARTGLPTVFVLEGGYALDAVGPAVANVLEAFEQDAL